MRNNKKVLMATLATLCLSTAAFGGAVLGASAADTDANVFKAVDGASVKIMNDNTDSGIRFTYMMSKTKYASIVTDGAFNDGVSVTAYIVPTDLVETNTAEAIIADADTAKREIVASKWQAQDEDWMVSYSYLYNLPQASYARSISAVAVLNDGTNTYTSDVETRSMVEVANNLLYVNNWTGAGSEILKNYLAGYSYELALNTTSANLLYSATEDVEDSVTLTANTNLNTKITWTSDNEDVATVENGVVTATGAGTAKITATVEASGETATCNVTVGNCYAISTLADFWAIDDSAEAMDAYYILKNDLDFTGKTLNVDQEIADWHTIGWKKGADISGYTPFTGTFDGNGYALKNIVMAGDTGTRGIFASLFGYAFGATIKNTYVDMEILNTGNNVKCAGLIAYMRDSKVENCFVSLKTQYLSYQATGNVGPVCGTKAGTSYIDNTVGVLDVSDGILGTATTAGSLAGEFNGYINNSFGVALKAAGNNSNYNLNGAGWAGGSNNGNLDSLTALCLAMSADGVLTAANGWNTNIWTITATENGKVLKFGDEVIGEFVSVINGGVYSLKDAASATVSGFEGSVIDVLYNGTSVKDYCDTSVSGKLTVPATVMATLSVGEQEFVVKTASETYKVQLIVATDVITTTDEFFAMNNNLAGYYVLGQNIDFSAGTINETEGWNMIGKTKAGAMAGYGDCDSFSGVFDGNGYALTNITVQGTHSDHGFWAGVFGEVSGTVKNVYVDMAYANNRVNLKEVGFVVYLLGGTIDNCFVRFSSKYVAYGNNITPVVAGILHAATIKNTIAVFDATDGIVNPNSGTGNKVAFFGASASGVGNVFTNSYGIALKKDGETLTPVYYGASAGHYTQSGCGLYTSYAEMFTKNSTNFVEANGWNMNIWKVIDGALYFGNGTDVATLNVVYQA